MNPAHVEAEKNIKTAVVNKKLVSAETGVESADSYFVLRGEKVRSPFFISIRSSVGVHTREE